MYRNNRIKKKEKKKVNVDIHVSFSLHFGGGRVYATTMSNHASTYFKPWGYLTRMLTMSLPFIETGCHW
jgi:hypothetical protein